MNSKDKAKPNAKEQERDGIPFVIIHKNNIYVSSSCYGIAKTFKTKTKDMLLKPITILPVLQ